MAATAEAIARDVDGALAYTQGAAGALLSAPVGRSTGQCPSGKPRRVHGTRSEPRRTSVQLPGTVESPALGGCKPKPPKIPSSQITGAKRDPSNGCSPAIGPDNRSRRLPWRMPADRRATGPQSASRSRRTPCVMRSPSICWRPALTCAPSSCCSGIAA